ncbi:hypothetical protein EC973_003463 [Apophysomyces ossiformis]|uniref:Bromo domain-containing protein n=1 Tax=Apophysomyces ossiformis TaxID=679940 RepID=A0A8H7BFR3_9FUNG|nr:hypothetical protein EC973_003463 [Apophysomyces ossiformis]
MEGRPKRQSAIDKDYRERKRLRRDEKIDHSDKNSKPEPEDDVVATQCRQLYKAIKEAKDTEGDNHLLSTFFQQLPSKRSYPDYYDVIKSPIALNNIKTKIDQKEYISLAKLKADIDLMVTNAKKYNMKESQVFEDAVKIQKIVKSWQPEDSKAIRHVATESRGKTVLKLPGEAFGRNGQSDGKIKTIRLKAVDKQANKKDPRLEELMAAITKRDTKKATDILGTTPLINPNELVEVEMFNDKFTWGPLHAAAYYGDIKVCQALINHGADVELHDTWYSATPLGWAAYGDRDKVVKLLVETYNANKNAKNIHGQIPFDVVSDKDDPRWVGLLKGPYPPIQAENKKTQPDRSSPHKEAAPVEPSAPPSISPSLPQQQTLKKRRGRPPKSESESMLAAQRPVDEIDLDDFDPVAYMKELFNAIRSHTDNVGRLYSEIFEGLPDRKEYPDYYNVISKPRSLTMVDERMRNRGYATLADWMADMELVFENAMEYNEPGSRVYRDAKLLMRLLYRLKDRFLAKEGVPASQEKDVMKLNLSDRPFDATGMDDRRRVKRPISKPRPFGEGSAEPEQRTVRPYINLGTAQLDPASQTLAAFPMPGVMPMPTMPTDSLITIPDYNSFRAPLVEPPQHQLPQLTEASSEFFGLFDDMDKVRLLANVTITATKTPFRQVMDGEMLGHSIIVPSEIDQIRIMPMIQQVLRGESKRVTLTVLHNNCKLNVAEAEVYAEDRPPCWIASLTRGMNTIKINVTANITKPGVMVPDYRSQTYILFVTQTW